MISEDYKYLSYQAGTSKEYLYSSRSVIKNRKRERGKEGKREQEKEGKRERTKEIKRERYIHICR